MLTIEPAKAPLRGRVRVPGDKSISHRALILAGVAEGRSHIEGLGGGGDIASTRAAMESLGVAIEKAGGGLEVSGRAMELCAPDSAIDCGNSGTTMRLLTGLLAGQDFASTLDGDASLRRRPMARVTEPLTGMGAGIESDQGHAPVRINGRRLAASSHALEVPSAQLKSALLLAGMQAGGVTEVSEPRLSRDHTERMLAFMGVGLERRGLSVSVAGPVVPEARRISIPGDPSSAAFLVVAALLVPGSEITVEGLCLNPTRTGFIGVLRRMGADLETAETGEFCGEPTGTVTVRASRLSAVDIGADEIPATIDELPLLAVAAATAEGRTRIWGAGELRVKESDRIVASRAMLERMGVRVQEQVDGIEIEGGTLSGDREVDGGGDHRMVMCAAVAALVADGPLRIAGSQAAGVSFPDFFETLAGLRS